MLTEIGNCTIVTGDALETLRLLPECSIQTCVTSPPYWGLRDYGKTGQLGLESTPQEYVEKMVAVFREVRRVLRNDGTLWLNLGDSYAGSWGNSGSRPELDGKTLNQRPKEADYLPRGGWDSRRERPASSYPLPGIKRKELIGIPWRVAFALQADGWYLRQDIVWAKPNPMPESVRDRCTKSHEYIFMLTKSEKYYFDSEAIKEPAAWDRWGDQKNTKALVGAANIAPNKTKAELQALGNGQRNKRSVWTVTTKPFSGAHFATFPPDLIEPCILAGSSEKGRCPHCGSPWKRVVEKGAPDLEHQRACGGDANGEYDGVATKDYAAAGAQDASATKARILAGMVAKVTTGWVPTCTCPAHEPVPCHVLDPFAGAGTTGLVAQRLGRASLLIELNPAYVGLIETRLKGA